MYYVHARSANLYAGARATEFLPAFSTVAVTNRFKTIDLCIAQIDYVSITYLLVESTVVCIVPIDYLWLPLKIDTIRYRYR